MADNAYLDGAGVAQLWQATKDYADKPDHITDAMLAQGIQATLDADSYYATLMPQSFMLYYFNPEIGSYGGDNTRLCYAAGISTHGAKAIDVEIASGYVWNAYFYNDDTSYALVQQYSNAWLSDTVRYIPVPDGANRVQVQARKSDGSAFTDQTVLPNVFKVVLRGAAERDLYEYDESTDLHSAYYGHYQYVGAPANVNEYQRLTEERLYKIGDYKLLGLEPKSGYWLVVNFFDENLLRLGNNGGWITSKQFVNLAMYPTAAYFKISYRAASGATLTPADYNSFSWYLSTIKTLMPVLAKEALDFINMYTTDTGDIATYNGTFFFADTGKLYVNGTTEISAAVGHGNNVMFGKTLDGSFPRLYAGSWYQGEKKVYVSRVTNSAATLLQTIEYGSLPTGFLNMCVDEPNERVYIFMETGADTYQGDILFAVGDFNGNILSQKQLDVSIPIIQGMDFVDSVCYVTSGNGTAQYPNYLYAFDTSGNVLSKSKLDVYGEIEGISVDTDNTVYIKALKALYKL